jgi:UDP-glucose 4-epimerase
MRSIATIRLPGSASSATSWTVDQLRGCGHLGFSAVRALVTGGAGFIGSNLVDELLEGGHDVSVVDNLSTGRRENLDAGLRAGARLYEADITDGSKMIAVLAEARPDVVFHLAAQVDVRRAVANPAFDAAVNVGGTAVLLDAACAANVRRFLLASTGGAIYGDADRLPTPEQAPAAPISPYGASKASAETYLALYRRLHGLSVCALRLANVYGPRQDPLGEGGVIAIYCHAARERQGVRVFGDGRQTRDFVYVGDVTKAFIAASEDGADGTYNIGTGQETTVLELVERLDLEASFEPERPGEVRRSCLDPSAAQDALGWRAEVPLAAGLERTLRA